MSEKTDVEYIKEQYRFELERHDAIVRLEAARKHFCEGLSVTFMERNVATDFLEKSHG